MTQRRGRGRGRGQAHAQPGAGSHAQSGAGQAHQGVAAKLPAPLVLFLDLDGTIIGDVMHLVAEKEIVSSFCKSPAAIKEMKASHVSRMRYGVVRPRFDSFLRRVEDFNKGSTGHCIEIFVYTASEHAWAIYVVGIIEAAVGFRFNKPVFTRKNCHPVGDGTYHKSLGPLLPSVVTSLRRKGYGLTVAGLDGRVALVDNNPSVIRSPGDRARLITCPSYNFILAFDVIRLIDVDVMQAKYEQIAKLLSEFGMYPAVGEKDSGTPRSCRHFLRVYYASMVSRLRKTTRSENGAEIRDRFWVRLRGALLSPTLVSSFDVQHVKAIDRHIRA